MLAYCLHLAEFKDHPRTGKVTDTADELAALPTGELKRLADLLLDYPRVASGARIALDALGSSRNRSYGADNRKSPRVAQTTGGLSQRRNDPMTDVKPTDGTAT